MKRTRESDLSEPKAKRRPNKKEPAKTSSSRASRESPPEFTTVEALEKVETLTAENVQLTEKVGTLTKKVETLSAENAQLTKKVGTLTENAENLASTLESAVINAIKAQVDTIVKTAVSNTVKGLL